MEKPDVFSVPRRFDLATVLVAMSAFAALFSGLLLLDAQPEVLAICGGYLFAVAAGQGIAAKWNRPRTASMLVGILLSFAIGMLQVLTWRHGGLWPIQVIGMAFSSVIWGGLTGYLAGALVGGVFLVSHYLREWLMAGKRTAVAERPESESPWEEEDAKSE